MGNATLAITWVSLLAIVGCGQGFPRPTPVPEASVPEVSSAPASTTAESPPTSVPDVAVGAAADPGGDLWTQLQQAETRYFVLMRHALAPGTGDPANFQVNDCSTQRNLNEAGREQARRTGDAFRQRGVAVSQVLSSQWCRCLETAELLAIGEVEPFPPLNSFFQDRSTADAQTEQVRQFMVENSDTPGVTVMVTHFVNIAALSGASVTSGEMVVMQVNDANELAVVGSLDEL